MMDNPRICVIGAGCSGITAVKNLLQHGLTNVVCYEQNASIGGNWLYSEQESHSSVCSTTHLISSKKLSAYEDFPMPDDYPDYPSHEQVLAYFNSYVDHFGLQEYIQFNSRVSRANKLTDEKWEIILEGGSKETFDFLLIANGHHSAPRHPEFKDHFTGEYVHSHSFKNNKNFRDKKVLVVGAGNSGCDCAVEISRVADRVDISIRTPQYIIPKFILGKPVDVFNEGTLWLPSFLKGPLFKLTLRLLYGRYRDYGMQEPKHSPLTAHPTLNTELLYKIRHGKIKPRVGIERVEGNKVFYKDGESQDYDVMLAATGYKISTPFFDPEFLDYSESDRVPMYLRMFHPEHPSLIFIGLFQPQGAIWPGSDKQAKLAANYIKGTWKWPKNIAELAEADADEIERKFLARKRHTIEVDYHDFVKKIDKQIPDHTPAWK